MSTHFDGCDKKACAPGCPVLLRAQAARNSAPPYAGMSDAERTERARAGLEILRRLDTATLGEVLVLKRCLDQIEDLRKVPEDLCRLDALKPDGTQ